MIKGGFIIGFESGTASIFQRQIDFIQKSGIVYLLALPRSIIRLGIFDRQRIYCWKLFFWTLLRKPRLFPLAITFTIYGYHFRQICDLRIS